MLRPRAAERDCDIILCSDYGFSSNPDRVWMVLGSVDLKHPTFWAAFSEDLALGLPRVRHFAELVAGIQQNNDSGSPSYSDSRA